MSEIVLMVGGLVVGLRWRSEMALVPLGAVERDAFDYFLFT